MDGREIQSLSKNSIYLSVIPAVLKPESIPFNASGYPITDFGHDKNKRWHFLDRLHIPYS